MNAAVSCLLFNLAVVSVLNISLCKLNDIIMARSELILGMLVGIRERTKLLTLHIMKCELTASSWLRSISPSWSLICELL